MNMSIEHNSENVRASLQITLEKTEVFFDHKTKLLLELIHEDSNVKNACIHMSLSYSKAWKMLNVLEKELGYPVVDRQHGGSHGGHTYLTEKGLQLLHCYQEFEQQLQQYANHQFRQLFSTIFNPEDDKSK